MADCALRRHGRYAVGWLAVVTIMLPVLMIDALGAFGKAVSLLGAMITDVAEFAAYDRKWSNRLFDISEPVAKWAKRR